MWNSMRVFSLSFIVHCFVFAECWNPEPHQRPTFKEILDTLEEIKCSSFIDTPEDSYCTMQEDWKVEIEQMFDELRLKEKVRTPSSSF